MKILYMADRANTITICVGDCTIWNTNKLPSKSMQKKKNGFGVD